jgi:hypothetical protein
MMYRFLIPAAFAFVAAAALALAGTSTWLLLLLRVVLITAGIALLIVGLRQRRTVA